MKFFLLVPISIFSLLLAGCNTVTSSYQYTKGTASLQKGDFEAAISHLEEAVKLEPNMARNQTNLSSAYMMAGDLQNAWLHARQATLATVYNESEMQIAVFNLMQLWKTMKEKYNINVGTTQEEIISFLGEPDDMIAFKENNQTALVYGVLPIRFEEGKFVKAYATEIK